jgi:biopolymer transport protein ExbB
MGTIAGRPVISIFTGEWPMWILSVLSIFAITLIVERLLYFRRNGFNTDKGFVRFRELMREGNRDEAMRFVKSENNPMGRMLAFALQNAHLTAEELSDLMYGVILDEKLLYERFLGGIGTMANVATLVGLLGTVWGLIIAFDKVYSASGSGGAKVVAGGIAVALMATLVGLFVGILSLAFFNYFNKKAGDISLSLESMAEKVVVMLSRAQRRSPAVVEDPEKPKSVVQAPKPAARLEKSDEDAAWRF